jgi:GT2 family glycosyltransferase
LSGGAAGGPASLPTVTLIIANLNGEQHLRPCLDSVAALDYDRDRLDVVVVDNASTDGSRALVADRYPWVRVLPQEANLGFAEAVNVAAADSSAECIALMNNDMRLDPAWLRALVDAHAPEDGYPCVAGLILDWEGERIDFAQGFVNFHGAGGQDRFGHSRDQVDVEDGLELLFACGGSMLVTRRLFLDLGGFDAAFFAYFEDVDLGWRLWIAGHKVRLAAGAVSFHRHAGTGGTLAPGRRTLIFERNWLLMLIKNVDEPHVWRLLSAALLLLNQRALLDTAARSARLEAVAEVVDDLDAILERRRLVQASRRRSDSEVFRLFDRPFAPVQDDAPYLEAMVRVSQALGLADLFPERRATRLLVLSFSDNPRLWELARTAAGVMSVVYASPRAPDSAADGIEAVELTAPAVARQLAAEVDFVLGSGGDAELASFADDLRAGLLFHDAEADGRPEVVRAGTPGSGPSVELVRPGDETAFFRSLASEPWQWRRADRGDPGPPEDVLALLAKWRRDYGVHRSPRWHLAHATWRLVPESIRVGIRPYLRRGLRRRA